MELALSVELRHHLTFDNPSFGLSLMIQQLVHISARRAFAFFMLFLLLALPFGAEAAEKKLSFEAIQTKAEAGDADSQYAMGLHYLHGEGVEKNFDKAFTWLTKAADQNHTPAQYDLGVMYALGEGVEKDYAMAEKLYRKAADKNYPEALYGLGVMYERGEGLKKDTGEAAKYYRQAANVWRQIYQNMLSEKK